MRKMRLRWMYGVVVAIHPLLTRIAYADLPIHATMSQILGRWDIQVSTLSGETNPCGSGIPNRNIENLALASSGILPSPRFSFSLDLTSETGPFVHKSSLVQTPQEEFILTHPKYAVPNHRRNYRWLKVYENGKAVGHWTMIYDQGYEVRLLNEGQGMSKDEPTDGSGLKDLFASAPLSVVLTSVLKYSEVSVGDCKKHRPANDDQEDATGETRCYKTIPGETLLGWVRLTTAGGEHQYGCFHGSKRYEITHDKQSRKDSYIVQKKAAAKSAVPARSYFRPAPYDAVSFVALSENISSQRVLTRRSGWQLYRGSGNDPNVPLFLENESRSLYACSNLKTLSRGPSRKNELLELPLQFSSFPDPFLAPASFRMLDNMPVMEQRACGACFAIASGYVLQARAMLKSQGRAAVFAMNSHIVPELSPQTILSCSFESQGCSGGFPYYVGKFAVETGIPSHECASYRETDDSAMCRLPEYAPFRRNSLSAAKNFKSSVPKDTLEFSASSACSPEKRIYAKDYGYVGGCYECCNERAMMEEIFVNGPIVAAIDAPNSLFLYTEGIFDLAQEKHARLCDHRGFNGWEFTNHAVVIVGWGEERSEERSEEWSEEWSGERSETSNGGDTSSVKYWIVRNSWGPGWGVNGYFKMRRGDNLNAAEAHAIWIDVDENRGLLKQISPKGIRPLPKRIVKHKFSNEVL